MTFWDVWTAFFVLPGVAFISVGTIGVLRLGDLPSRIHALAKADTLGLGLVVVALLPQAGSVGTAAKLVLVWALALVSAAAIAHLLARGTVTTSDSRDAGMASNPQGAGTTPVARDGGTGSENRDAVASPDEGRR